MFCPEGYKTIHEVRCSVADFQWTNNLENGQTSSDKFESLVFDTLLENDALRICSPQGIVMKVSDEILDQIDILDFIDAKYFPIEYFHELLDTELGQKRWTGMPLFFERTHYTITLSSYREYKKVALTIFDEHELWETLGLPFELDVMWGLVASLEGYALCAVECMIPNEIHTLQNRERSFISKKRGRPSFRPEILAFYKDNFQNGHKSWKQVQNKWIAETGHNVSLDTIKRAVKIE